MLDRIRNEPVVVVSLVSSALALGVAFGLELSDVQIAAVLAFVNSALALVVRRQVTPAPAVRNDSGSADLNTGLLVAAVIGIVLVLFGIRF